MIMMHVLGDPARSPYWFYLELSWVLYYCNRITIFYRDAVNSELDVCKHLSPRTKEKSFSRMREHGNYCTPLLP